MAEAQTACNALDACSGFSVSTGEFDDPVWTAQAAAEAAGAAAAAAAAAEAATPPATTGNGGAGWKAA